MIVVSWGNMPINDGTNYVSSLSAGGQVPAEMSPGMVGRIGGTPVVGAMIRPERYLVIETHLNPQVGIAQKRTLQRQWYEWFAFGVKRQLVIADDDGSNERYIWATPFVVAHTADGDGWEWETMVVMDGDVDGAWRSVLTSVTEWAVVASGAETTITNGGELDSYPVICLTPAVEDLGQQDTDNYSRFVLVKWRATAGATKYPVDITDGGLDTQTGSTNFLSAAGDDIRIYVDGVDTDYWLNGINTAATSIWVNLDFAAAQSVTLASGIDDGEVTTLAASGDLSGFPSSGLLLIGSEVFTYGSRTSTAFNEVTRAMGGTTAASHSAAAAVEWIQHDIRLEYGATGMSAKTVDASKKPIFKLSTSDNELWVYEEFYDSGASRAGAWTFENYTWGVAYGGNDGAAANPFEELGIYMPLNSTYDGWRRGSAHWYLFNPCGITAANFTNGHYRNAWYLNAWNVIRSSPNGSMWATLYSIPSEYIVGGGAMKTWGYNATSLPAGTRYVSMLLDGMVGAQNEPSYRVSHLECADVSVTLDDSVTPVVSVGAELNPMPRVNAVLTNVTTGEALAIAYGLEEGDTELKIDVDRYNVQLSVSGRRMLSAVAADSIRTYLLRLAPGANVLRYDDVVVSQAGLRFEYEKRWRI